MKPPVPAFTDWSIPDWRDSSAYLTDNESPNLFAWEFLRRNANYRKSWRTWRDILAKAGLQDWIPGRKFPDGYDFSLAVAALWHLQPNWLEGETLAEYEDRLGEGVEYRCEWGGNFLARGWGLPAGTGGLLDPRDPHWERGVRNGREFLSVSGVLDMAFHSQVASFQAPMKPLPISGDTVAIYFSASEPIEPQLEQAKKILAHAQATAARRGRPVITHAPKERPTGMHLRILDACAVGVTIAEIARTLYPHESRTGDRDGGTVKKVRAGQIKAEELRDGGWRKLLLVRKKNRD